MHSIMIHTKTGNHNEVLHLMETELWHPIAEFNDDEGFSQPNAIVWRRTKEKCRSGENTKKSPPTIWRGIFRTLWQLRSNGFTGAGNPDHTGDNLKMCYLYVVPSAQLAGSFLVLLLSSIMPHCLGAFLHAHRSAYLLPSLTKSVSEILSLFFIILFG